MTEHIKNEYKFGGSINRCKAYWDYYQNAFLDEITYPLIAFELGQKFDFMQSLHFNLDGFVEPKSKHNPEFIFPDSKKGKKTEFGVIDYDGVELI